MNFIGNIIWLLLGGIIASILWFIAGLILCISRFFYNKDEVQSNEFKILFIF